MTKNRLFIILFFLGLLSYAPIGQAQFKSFPWTENFENLDVNTLQWQYEIYGPNTNTAWYYADTRFDPSDSRWAHGGHGLFYSTSSFYYFINGLGGDIEEDFEPDNWLISPAIKLPCSFTSATLEFYAISLDYGSGGDKLSVYIATSDDPTQVSTSPVYTVQLPIITDDWSRCHFTLNLSDYAGKTIYIMFRHQETNQSYIDFNHVANNYNYNQHGANEYDFYSGVAIDDLTLDITDAAYTHSEPTESANICNGQSYTWSKDGNSYSTEGTQNHTTSHGGCDTTFTLSLTVNPTYNNTKDTSGARLTVNGTIYHASGTYTYNGTTTTGCDSITIYNYTFKPDTLHVYYDTCVIDGTTLADKQTTISPYGYDSVIDTHYLVHPAYSYAPSKDTVKLSGLPYTSWRSRNITDGGTYYDSLTTVAHGCDSIYTLILLVRDTVYVSSEQAGCDQVVFNGSTYTSDTNLVDTTANGSIDTIYTLSIYIDTIEIADSIVKVFSYQHEGQTYVETKTLPLATGACDSIRFTINIPTKHLYTDTCILSTLNIASLPDSTDSIYHGTLPSLDHDSITIIHYTVYTKYDTTVHDTATSLPYLWEGHSFDTIGTATETLTTADGKCDSLVTLLLHVRDTIRDTLPIFSGCDSIALAYDGLTYYADTTLYDTTSHDGRDTIFIYRVKIDTVEQRDSIIAHGTYFDWDSDGDGIAERYDGIRHPEYDTLTFAEYLGSCDSIRLILPLKYVHDTTCTIGAEDAEDTTTSVLHDLYYRGGIYDTVLVTYHHKHPSYYDTIDIYGTYRIWMGVEYVDEGDYLGLTDSSLRTIHGCDSHVTQNIHINKHQPVAINGCSDATYKGTTYYSDTTFLDSVNIGTNYDTIYKVVIRLRPSYEMDSTIWDTIYSWDGTDYTVTDTFTLQTIYGCDSIFRMNIAIRDTVHRDTCVPAIVPIDTASIRLVHATGQPAIDTLRATVFHPRTSIRISMHHYGNDYYWHQTQYSTEGEYVDTDTLRSVHGCDSIVTLTIHISKHAVVPVYGCDSASYKGITYYHDTNFTDTITYGPNSGNDSFYYIGVKVFPSKVRDSIVWATYFTWDGQTYMDNRSFTLQTTQNCDSVVRMRLIAFRTIHRDTCLPTIVTLPAKYDSIRTPEGNDTLVTIAYNVHRNYDVFSTVYSGHFEWNGIIYNEEGEYDNRKDTLTTMHGCDSIVTLNIIIGKSRSISLDSCDTVRYKDVAYTRDTTFNDTVNFGPNHDTIYRLRITIHHSVSFDSLVPGTTFVWNGITYGSDQTFTLNTSHGCDSTVTLRVVEDDTIRSFDDRRCLPDSTSLTSDTNIVTLSDSEKQTIIYFHQIFPSRTTTLPTRTIYSKGTSSDSFQTTTWPTDNDTIRRDGTYTTLLHTTHGCDSLIQLSVTFIDTLLINTADTICGPDENDYHDTSYRTMQTDGRTLTTMTIHTALHRYDYNLILPDSVVRSSATSADDFTLLFWPSDTDTIRINGTYGGTIASSFGCDSTIQMKVIFMDTLRLSRTRLICTSRDYDTTHSDTTYTTASGRNLTTIRDTLYHYRSTIYDTILDTIGHSFTWKGTTYVRDTILAEHYRTTAGCDSVRIIRFLVPDTIERTAEAVVCNDNISSPFDTIVIDTTTIANITYYTTTTNHNCPTYHVYDTVHSSVTIWHGRRFAADTIYHDTLHTAMGCDSIVTLVFTFNCITFGPTIDTEGCDPYVYAGNTYHHATDSIRIYDTLSNANMYGCDSIRQIVALIHPSFSDSVFYELPYEGGSFRWLHTAYMDSGTYYDTAHTIHGCDSTFVIVITREDPPFVCDTTYSDTTIEVCNGIRWIGGSYRRFSGIYVDTVVRENGCDSVVTLNLTVKQPSELTWDTTACDFIYWRGHTYSSTTDTMLPLGIAINGCDSVEYVTFHIKKSTFSYDTLIGCGSLQYDNVTFHGTQDYYGNPTTNSVGCDSIAKMRIIIRRNYSIDTEATACDSFPWQGLTYTHSGVYSHTIGAANGCDSTLNLLLTIKYSQHDEVTAEDCEFFSYNHKSYDASGIYMDTVEPTADGCLHTASLRLTIHPAHHIVIDTHVCDSLVWHDDVYKNNVSSHFDTYDHFGCDSTETLNLSVTKSSKSNRSVTACESYLWFDSIYTESTSDIHHTLNHVGCDSSITLRLTIIHNDTTDTTLTACNFFRWHGKTYTHSVVDTFTLNDGNCVSVDVLHLTLGSDTRTNMQKTVCDSFVWNDSTYTISTTTTRYMQSIHNCDSVVTLNLDIRRTTYADVYAHECDRYFWHDSLYTASTDSAQFVRYNRAGCDSIVTLHLDMHYSIDSCDTVLACDRYLYNNHIYTFDDQLYASRGRTIHGCDSSYTLTLLLGNSGKQYFDTVTACNQYVWIDDSAYTQDTTVTLTLYDRFSCEYTRTLLLSMLYDTYQHDTVEACNFYEWNNQPFYESTEDSILTTDSLGCTFHHSLTLYVYPDRNGYLDTEVCQILTLSDGATYTSETSSLRHAMGKTVKGCDSTLIITLHIGNRFAESILPACDSLTYKGITYTASQTIFDTIHLANGCDSLQTLHLQITPTAVTIEEVAACDSFVWQRNGNTYYHTTGAIDTVRHSNTCDSVFILLIAIKEDVYSEKNVTTNEPYVWNDITYTTNGTYYQTFPAANGCDSIAMVNLYFTHFATPIIYSHSNRLVLVNHYPYGENAMRVDYYAYRWYHDGTLVEGANDDSFGNEHGNALNGCFTVAVAVDEEQEHWLMSNIICFGTAGINDVQEESADLSVYPNPIASGSTLTITSTLPENQLHGAMLSLFDRQGREVMTQPAVQTTTIPIQQPAGLYLLQIRTANGKTLTTKIIVR